MKKVFAILLVLAVVAGFVFADTAIAGSETHKIKVKADVAEVLPAFNLTYGGFDTNGLATKFVNGASYPTSTQSDAIDVNFDLDEGGTFTVTAEVVNAVKTNRVFTLSFSGGVFSVSRDGVATNQYLSPSKLVVTGSSAHDAVSDVSAAVTKENETSAYATNAELVAAVSITFSGVTAKDVDINSPIPVATAAYTYVGDATIDPTKLADGTENFYYTDVVMTVSTT